MAIEVCAAEELNDTFEGDNSGDPDGTKVIDCANSRPFRFENVSDADITVFVFSLDCDSECVGMDTSGLKENVLAAVSEVDAVGLSTLRDFEAVTSSEIVIEVLSEYEETNDLVSVRPRIECVRDGINDTVGDAISELTENVGDDRRVTDDEKANLCFPNRRPLGLHVGVLS